MRITSKDNTNNVVSIKTYNFKKIKKQRNILFFIALAELLIILYKI